MELGLPVPIIARKTRGALNSTWPSRTRMTRYSNCVTSGSTQYRELRLDVVETLTSSRSAG